MSEENTNRLYLTCGSVFLLVFSLASAITIITLGPGTIFEIVSVIALTVSASVLLFNSALLFGSNGGAVVLKTGRAFLWLSFLLMETAAILCTISMISNP